jgi:hypothetical protein
MILQTRWYFFYPRRRDDISGSRETTLYRSVFARAGPLLSDHVKSAVDYASYMT